MDRVISILNLLAGKELLQKPVTLKVRECKFSLKKMTALVFIRENSDHGF
jgi:hypothetical protein